MRSASLVSATLLVGLIGLFGSAPAAAGPGDHTRYVSLGGDALDAAHAAWPGDALDVIAYHDGIAVVAMDERDLGALAERIHERSQHCGGFMVHESLADAYDAIAAQDREAVRPGLDYTLDRAAVVRAVLPAVDAARIHETIRELSAMQNRYYQSETGAAASRWLRDRWRSLTDRTDVTIELVDHGYAQKSLVLTIPGSTRASEVVVIGGHLDSIAPGGTSSTAPGADDDASGIATLTEVLRALLAADYRPARTLQFMAYAAEEVGLRGSLRIARDYQQRHIDVVGVLQLDMTNYQGSDKDIWLMKDFTSAAQNTFLTRLIDSYVGATWGLDACGYACSDHAAWHRSGFPASMPFESRTRDRNRKIHTRNDTLETSGNNAAHAVKFARLAAAYAIELGKGGLGVATETVIRPPAVTHGNDFGWGSLAGLAGAVFLVWLWLVRTIAARAR